MPHKRVWAAWPPISFRLDIAAGQLDFRAGAQQRGAAAIFSSPGFENAGTVSGADRRHFWLVELLAECLAAARPMSPAARLLAEQPVGHLHAHRFRQRIQPDQHHGLWRLGAMPVATSRPTRFINSTMAAPTTFIQLDSVNYNPANHLPCSPPRARRSRR